MLKMVASNVWCFDTEWVPDPSSGRRAYGLPAEMPDAEVLEVMWHEGGATDDEPRPYLKTVLCRVVSVAAVVRRKDRDGRVRLTLQSLPEEGDFPGDEASILARFLGGLGKDRPQIVGYNSIGADLKILVQRALVHRLRLPEFCARPNKPWEGVDYFAKGSDWNIDLRDELGGFGRSVPSLHELATACGIPGKVGVDGSDVVDLWTAGKVVDIVGYNECDALTTYLLWLRTAHLAGHITTGDLEWEEAELGRMVAERCETGSTHLAAWLERWQALRA